MSNTEQEVPMFAELARLILRPRATLVEDALGAAALFLMLFAMLQFAGAA